MPLVPAEYRRSHSRVFVSEGEGEGEGEREGEREREREKEEGEINKRRSPTSVGIGNVTRIREN